MSDAAGEMAAPTSARRGRALVVLLAVLLMWFVVGMLRAPGAAASYLSDTERPRLVSEVSATTFPAVPPFFLVQIQATITEPAGAHYTSAQFLLVEPLSGWTVNLSHLGLAPSAWHG